MKLRRLHRNYFQEVIIMTNIEKTLALINCFATGDTETAKGLLAPGYIQHNLAYGTGADAFVGSVAYLGSAPVKTTVNNIRAFEDGDKVFLQNVYNFAGMGEQVAFDIFCFDADGKIAEQLRPEAMAKAAQCFEKIGQAGRADQMRGELKRLKFVYKKFSFFRS